MAFCNTFNIRMNREKKTIPIIKRNWQRVEITKSNKPTSRFTLCSRIYCLMVSRTLQCYDEWKYAWVFEHAAIIHRSLMPRFPATIGDIAIVAKWHWYSSIQMERKNHQQQQQPHRNTQDKLVDWTNHELRANILKEKKIYRDIECNVCVRIFFSSRLILLGLRFHCRSTITKQCVRARAQALMIERDISIFRMGERTIYRNWSKRTRWRFKKIRVYLCLCVIYSER